MAHSSSIEARRRVILALLREGRIGAGPAERPPSNQLAQRRAAARRLAAGDERRSPAAS
jgi:hypothetical protein